MKNIIISLVYLTLLLTFSKYIYPQAGQLDNTFGHDGIVTTALKVNGTSQINSIVLQSDGKLVAAGVSNNGINADFTLARYTQDGSLDNSFGTNGIVITQIGDTNDCIESVVIQTDEKILTGGYSIKDSANDFALARYNPDGSLDNSFGTNGIVTTPIGDKDDKIFSIALQSDGKIVAGGSYIDSLYWNFAVVRYNPDGSLDNSFGTNGIVTTSIGPRHDVINTVLIQPDGKIIAVGYSYNGENYDFAVVRYNPNGFLDDTFGNDGIVTTPVGTGNDAAYPAVLQSDGRIIAACYSHNGHDEDFALVRYNPNGTPDNTFGENGIVVTQVGTGKDRIYSLAVQNDGKIVAAGHSVSSTSDFAVARYKEDGSIDESFGSNGITITPVGTLGDLVFSVLVQGDGKIVAAGYSVQGGNNNFAVVRYNENGTKDNSFGEYGIVTTPVGMEESKAYSVKIQNDGKIVAAGYTLNEGTYNFAVVRYNPDGSPDISFGTGGIVITQIGPSNSIAYSLAIQKDGKIIIGGKSSNGSNNDFCLARYNINGTLDNSFGTDGIVTTEIGTSTDVIQTIAIQSNESGIEKIIAAGQTYKGSGSDFALARYNLNGTLDVSFGINGIVTTDIDSRNDGLMSIAVQGDGKILALGYSNYEGNNDFALARYNTDGTLDNSFSGNGIVITQVGDAGDYGRALTIQNDGKIVAAGYSFSGTYCDFALTRYNTDGSLDVTFADNGIISVSYGALNDFVYSIAIQNDGKIVAAGGGRSDNEGYDFVLSRYKPDGSTDSTFGLNGVIITPIGVSSCYALSVALQDDGKIVAAGCSDNDDGYCVFSLVRYNSDPATGISRGNLNELPTSFSLEQNFPNPFNPLTTIRFSIPKQQTVRLSVYNLLGQHVRTLVDKEINAGDHSVVFNAGGLVSGVYFYRLQTESFVSTKRFILLK